MLSTLITSKTRVKLLLKFFLNSNTSSYLKNLESEFEDSSNGIRLELNKFEKAGLLLAESMGNKKMFKANVQHPLFRDIHNIILKYAGIDRLIEDVVERLGNVQYVYLVGSFAKGLESKVIDLIIIGDVNRDYLMELVSKAEKMIEKKIKFVIYNHQEFQDSAEEILHEAHLLIWSALK
ncbi:MAG: nucleotidyltransferase domain-containing protein [Bacteroidia bacterium]|jgi:predicted nucleotidyltransferase